MSYTLYLFNGTKNNPFGLHNYIGLKIVDKSGKTISDFYGKCTNDNISDEFVFYYNPFDMIKQAYLKIKEVQDKIDKIVTNNIIGFSYMFILLEQRNVLLKNDVGFIKNIQIVDPNVDKTEAGIASKKKISEFKIDTNNEKTSTSAKTNTDTSKTSTNKTKTSTSTTKTTTVPKSKTESKATKTSTTAKSKTESKTKSKTETK